MLYSPFSDEMIEALSKPHVTLLLAAEFYFDSGTSYVHTGVGNLLFNSNVYTGLGDFGSINSISLENTLSPSQLSLRLSGLNAGALEQSLNEPCVNREFKGYLISLDEAGEVNAADLLFEGFISDNFATLGKECAINFKVSNIFEKWNDSLNLRNTDESQRALYPEDRFFRYVSQMAERSIFWGSKKDAPGFVYD